MGKKKKKEKRFLCPLCGASGETVPSRGFYVRSTHTPRAQARGGQVEVEVIAAEFEFSVDLQELSLGVIVQRKQRGILI